MQRFQRRIDVAAFQLDSPAWADGTTKFVSSRSPAPASCWRGRVSPPPQPRTPRSRIRIQRTRPGAPAFSFLSSWSFVIAHPPLASSALNLKAWDLLGPYRINPKHDNPLRPRHRIKGAGNSIPAVHADFQPRSATRWSGRSPSIVDVGKRKFRRPKAGRSGRAPLSRLSVMDEQGRPD